MLPQRDLVVVVDENDAPPALEFTTAFLTSLAKKLEPVLKMLPAGLKMEESAVRGLTRTNAAAWLFTHKKEELVQLADDVCPKGSVATLHFKADYCRAIVVALFDPPPVAAVAAVRQEVAAVVTPSKARNVFISTSRETECSVCLEVGPDTALMCCGGCFHFKCLTQWVAGNTKKTGDAWASTCPLCRHGIPCPAPAAAAAAPFVAPRRDAQVPAHAFAVPRLEPLPVAVRPVVAPVAVAANPAPAAVVRPLQAARHDNVAIRGNNAPGADVCVLCHQVRQARDFSRTQWAKHVGERKCIDCIAAGLPRRRVQFANV